MASQISYSWIKSTIVPRIVNSMQTFEKPISGKIKHTIEEFQEDNLASNMFRVCIFSDLGDKSYIIKLMHEEEVIWKELGIHKQFFNEVFFYSVILPNFLSPLRQERRNSFESLFPKCSYSHLKENKIPENMKDAVVVLENLRTRNFFPSKRKFLDYTHCCLALRALGSFHALSYFMKSQNRETFKNLVSPLQILAYSSEVFDRTMQACQERAIEKLTEEFPEGDQIISRLQVLVRRRPTAVYNELFVAEEPYAVLCHGDFLRNNMMFSYEDDLPTDIKLMDFQKIWCTSPAYDVSMLFCNNTDHALRAKHFDELLRVYHDSLTESLSQLHEENGTRLEHPMTFEIFIQQMQKYSVLSYLMGVYFLPSSMSSYSDMREMARLWAEEPCTPTQIQFAVHLGGTEGTRAIAELAKDLVRRGFI